MSTLHEIKHIEFTKRKPSKAMVMRAIGLTLEKGAKAITVTWGENWIDLTFHEAQGAWYGHGWLKDISGDDIAHELNDIRAQALADIKASRKFYNDHFQFIHVGG